MITDIRIVHLFNLAGLVERIETCTRGWFKRRSPANTLLKIKSDLSSSKFSNHPVTGVNLVV